MGLAEQFSRLEAAVDVADFSFDQVMLLLRSYTASILLTTEVCEQLGVDDLLRQKFLAIVTEATQRHDPAKAYCEAERAAAWRLQMSLPKDAMASQLAELVALCTYDRASAEFDTFGPEAMFESILTTIFRLGDRWCDEFIGYALSDEWQRLL